MAHVSHSARPVHRRPRARGPLGAPVLLFVGATLLAAGYVAYVLWPRWPSAPVSLSAAPLPVMVSGTMFTVEPAAIRVSVQRRPGTQERLDLSYLWPSLTPPDPTLKPTVGAPLDPNERLFVTIANGEATLPIGERVKTIYPRYLDETASAGPPGLTMRAFRNGTPYQNEDMFYDPQAPERFLARCTRSGVGNSGMCLLERRIGNADLTLRFPRDWLDSWESVAKGADSLIARLHPAS